MEVSVADSGPGIAAEHHQEIFEDFVRVDRTSSGMGLGLAIAKRLVQAHRGKIWVESEPRRGCKFTFLLADGSRIVLDGLGGKAKGESMADKEKILVVDDEPSIRKYLQTLLEVDGYEVETVSSGARSDRESERRRAAGFHHPGRSDAGDERPRNPESN